MTTAVLGDGLIDYLGKRRELADIFPAGHAILRAGWREAKGCGGCGGAKIKPKGKVMDPDARSRFRSEILKADAKTIQRLKALLGVDTLSVYTRLTGNLSVTQL